jgi:DNA-binding SARP family transcriptional activator
LYWNNRYRDCIIDASYPRRASRGYLAGMDPNGNGGLDSLLRYHRRAAGLTQRQLAEAAHVSIGVVRDLEQGLTSRPRAASLHRLATVLGLGPGHPAGPSGPSRTMPALRSGRLRAASLRLQILGPLTAERDGAPVSLGSARQRTVLGLLAASPNRVVSRSQLSDALWGITPPQHAATMIQSYVSSLRRALDPGHSARARDGLIVSVGSGYQLNSNRIELDLDVFHGLVGQARAAAGAGDPASSYRAYALALELWRDQPLSDVEGLGHHPAVTSLARQRDRAVTDYAEVAASQGWYDGPLYQLELLIEREPFNERAFACYMIALAGTGQHAAALQAFEQVRYRLGSDLGLVPGPELQAAHAMVLQQQVPSAALTFQVAGDGPGYQLPAPVADFTGRGDETARLGRVLAGQPAAGRIVVLSGTPGAGKTALALHIAHELRSHFPHGQLWTRLADQSGRPRDPGDVLAELLRALGIQDWAIPAATEEKAALYRSRLARMQVLVVADDASSPFQLPPLLPGSGESAILITSQSEMAAPAGAYLHQLGAFPPAEAMELLARIIGAGRITAEARAGAQLVASCGGLPLAIRVVGMRLAARKSWQLSALVGRLTEPGRRLGELSFGQLSVRASFARVYDGLSERSQQAFRCLSLLDADEFAEAEIAAVLGTRDCADATAALADRSLLASVGIGEDGRPRYRIDSLLREYACELQTAHSPQDGAPRRPAPLRYSALLANATSELAG